MPASQLEQLEHAAASLRRQTIRALVLRRFCRWCGIWWFLWGGMSLALRTVWEASGWAAGAIAIPVLLLLAFFRERAALPGMDQFRAVVDDLTGSGGLLMAVGEGLAPVSWLGGGAVPCRAPALHWRARRLLALQVAGAAFLVLCLLAPTPRLGVVPAAPPVLDLRAMLADYQAQIEILAEENALSPTEEAELAAMAKRLAEEKSATDPESAWEAMDSLRNALDEKARAAAEQALHELVGAELAEQRLRELAQAVADGRLNGETAMAAAQELAKHLAAQPGGQELAEKLVAAAKQGKLGPDGLRQIAEAAGAAGAEAARQLGRLAEQGMIEEGQAGLAEAVAKGRAEANAKLAEFLAQQDAMGEEPCALANALGQTGAWDVQRGPGHQALTWTGGSSEENTGFQETALPSKRPEDWNDSQILGTDRTAPKPLDGPLAAATGRLAAAAADGGAARTHRILPRHRRTVATFFARTSPAGGPTP